jgi:hypothetical protein
MPANLIQSKIHPDRYMQITNVSINRDLKVRLLALVEFY